MLFNSLEFLLFLPIVFAGYWFIFGKQYKWQNAFVVVASYVFYGWWDWRFLLLIFMTSICSWGSGLLIQQSSEGAALRMGGVIRKEEVGSGRSPR